MGNGLDRRVDALEDVFGAVDDGSTLVERDADGRLERVAMVFAYRFDKAGEVTGIRFANQVHARSLDEPLWEFRRRVVGAPGSVWNEIIEQLPPSRGLPKIDYDVEAQKQHQAAVAADAVRRKGESEWGERVIGLVELMEAHDA